MSSGDLKNLRVRSIDKKDARAIGLLNHGIYAEIGQKPVDAIEKIESLFNLDWLQNGAGLVLEKNERIIGYGWARVTTWHRQDIIHMGLYLGPEARRKECYQLLTNGLFDIACQLSQKFRTNELMIFYRSADSIHPPILRERREEGMKG